jgi:DNA-binding NarL/FixJ family response regulator
VAIHLVTVEDDARYRASLEGLFRLTPDFTVVAGFSSAAAAVERVETDLRRQTQPRWDVVLMDLQLPGMSGVEGTRRLKELMPATPVVVLTVFEESSTVLEAICAGADGYVLKRSQPEELLEQVRSVMRGGSPLTAGVAGTVLALLRRLGGAARAAGPEAPSRLTLTDREQDVLRGLVQGLGYKEVADHLGVSIDTVRAHVRAVYRKLQVHTVAEAVGRAIREGLV